MFMWFLFLLGPGEAETISDGRSTLDCRLGGLDPADEGFWTSSVTVSLVGSLGSFETTGLEVSSLDMEYFSLFKEAGIGFIGLKTGAMRILGESLTILT